MSEESQDMDCSLGTTKDSEVTENGKPNLQCIARMILKPLKDN